MATIIVNANAIIDHVNDDGKIKVTSFSWSDTGRYNNSPDYDFEFDLHKDLEYVDDGYVTIDEYKAAQLDIQELTIEIEKSKSMIDELESQLLSAKNEASLAKQMLEDVLKLQAVKSKPKRKWLWF